MEAINRRIWRSAEVLRWYGRLEGYIDGGERRCFEELHNQVRDQPVLDLGVGGGRTTALLLEVTRAYVGLDLTPEMVATCRRKFPDVRVDEGDARDLSRFADGSFQLVVFSYNGIDLVHDHGRDSVLREVHRVLRPGGAFYFSTIHRDGPDFREPPQRQPLPRANPLRLATRAARRSAGRALGLIRRARYGRYEERRDGHSVLLHQALDYGLLVYATTIAELRGQLTETGYGPVKIVGAKSGKPILDGQADDEPYFHVIARKLGVGSPDLG